MFGMIERALVQVKRHTFTKTPIYENIPLMIMYFVCHQYNCMSLPVVYLDPTLDQELACRISGIITKHQVKGVTMRQHLCKNYNLKYTEAGVASYKGARI